MSGRIVKGDRTIKVRLGGSDVSGVQQRHRHQAMPDHERRWRSLLLGKC